MNMNPRKPLPNAQVKVDLKDAETGYPLLMIKLLPSGLLGLLLVAFLSAFMSTVSTHLNWGASYVVNDFYARFIRPKENGRRRVVQELRYHGFGFYQIINIF